MTITRIQVLGGEREHPSAPPENNMNFCHILELVNRTEHFRKCRLFYLFASPGTQVRKFSCLCVCLKSLKFRLKATKGTSVLLVHIIDLVLPTPKLETAVRPAQSLSRRISSSRITLKQTTGFCHWPWPENTYGCSPNWLTVEATPWCCLWSLK